ncbi:hypothetical protein C7212DRAFT_223356 [Tuber magnatum]|uniref:Uncharacterized protein n=1 Tax=Tuber magnatum TaxID=42249 RepID=A0A317SHQ5_9PEZI|nr:hypothetical protein C7212DRAFT_223356 [Tuber magnatum]
MPDSSPDSFDAPTITTEAQSSLLRISRRHSLPASTTFSNFFSLWGNDNDPAAPPGRDHYDHQNNVNQQQRRPGSNGTPRIVNGNGSGVGGNRHRYGHRHTRSAVVDQPVIVKSYNPGPASSSIASPVREEDDLEKLVLPSIDSFSFDGILKSIEPEVTSALNAVSRLCTEYQSSLQTEVDGLVEAQSHIDARMREADKLTVQALKTTKIRTERLDSESSGLKGGSAVDALAEAAEATHTTLTSIVTTLLAIDEMLPPQERLSPLTSAHKKHYPKLHGLLAEKAHELNVLFRSGKSAGTTIMPRHSRSEVGEASSSRGHENSVWMRRRMSSMPTSEVMLNTSGPALTHSNAFSHPRGVASPHLQLRTVLPSPSSPSPDPGSASAGYYYPLSSQAATSVSLTSPTGNSIAPVSPQANRRNSGLWGRRASSSALIHFPEGAAMRRTNTPTAETRGWRRSGSWGGLFGSGGKRSSLLSVDNGNEPDGAQERLRRVLEAGTDSRRGKGKAVP